MGGRDRRPGDASSAGGLALSEARVLLARFTPVALGAFLATVVAGGLEAIAQLGSIDALFGTAYGRVLLVKMALVAAMLPLSAMAWRMKRPHVRLEAALAAGVIGAALLSPRFPPRRRPRPGRPRWTPRRLPPRACRAAMSSLWQGLPGATWSA